jgi:CubicO group peptidase (beta-lactamase class C family)
MFAFVRLSVLLAVLAGMLPAQSTVSYHGASPIGHALQASTLTSQGYRPLTVSVAGTLTTPRISATWIQRAGPAWVMSTPQSQVDDQAWRVGYALQGYRPLLVSVDGSGSDTVYMTVCVADGVSAVFSGGHTAAGFDSQVASMRNAGLWPISIAVHGTAAAPRYSYVYTHNVDDVAWGYSIGDSAAVLGQKKAAHQEGEARPSYVAGSSFGHYASIWRDDRIGSWELVWDQPAASYQSAFNVYSSGGYFPLVIASHDSGANTRYSAIFVQNDTPQTRTPGSTGMHSGLLAFDSYMQNHLQAVGARAGALAITKHGRLVYARGFKLAEPGYQQTQPTDVWRLASLTKPITAAAIYHLTGETAVTLNTTLGTELSGYPYADARYPTITVAQLLRHTSGLIDNTDSWAVANWWNPINPVLPTTALLSARYAALFNLNFTPGTLWDYSNHGYITLGQIFSSYQLGGYVPYVQNEVLQPLSITQGGVGAPSRAGLAANEVHYHLRELTLEPSEFHVDRRPMTAQYNRNLTRSASSGGLVMSPIDYVRFLAGVFDGGGDLQVVTSLQAHSLGLPYTYSQLGGGTRQISNGGMTYEYVGGVGRYTKGGTLEGVSTEAVYRTDGVCIAAFVNKTYAHVSTNQLHALVDAVAAWPTVDLFPSYGYPPFQSSCPKITSTTNGTLPNVTQNAFSFFGTRFDEVQSVAVAGATITSQDASTWADGWFRIVSANVLEVHPPQGLAPGAFSLTLSSAICTTSPVPVTITLPPTAVLAAAAAPVGAFEALASLGNHSLGTYAFLGVAPDNVPTSVPGIVDLDIGAFGTTLAVWPWAIPVDPATSVFRWPVPDFSAYGPTYMQAALIDLLAPDPFPLSVTNVQLVTP